MKLSPVQWLLGEKEGETESDSGVSVHYLVQFFFSDEAAYFLSWAGGFSPASPSSSAWTCRSWSPQKYRACRPW